MKILSVLSAMAVLSHGALVMAAPVHSQTLPEPHSLVARAVAPTNPNPNNTITTIYCVAQDTKTPTEFRVFPHVNQCESKEMKQQYSFVGYMGQHERFTGAPWSLCEKIWPGGKLFGEFRREADCKSAGPEYKVQAAGYEPLHEDQFRKRAEEATAGSTTMQFAINNLATLGWLGPPDTTEAVALFQRFPSLYQAPDLFDPFTEQERLEASYVITCLPGLFAWEKQTNQIKTGIPTAEDVPLIQKYQFWMQFSWVPEDGVHHQKYGLSKYSPDGKADLPMASFVKPTRLKLTADVVQSVLAESLRVPGTVYVEQLKNGKLIAMRKTAGQAQPDVYELI